MHAREKQINEDCIKYLTFTFKSFSNESIQIYGKKSSCFRWSLQVHVHTSLLLQIGIDLWSQRNYLNFSWFSILKLARWLFPSYHHITFSDCLELSMNVDRLWTQTTISLYSYSLDFLFCTLHFCCYCFPYLFQIWFIHLKWVALILKMDVTSIDCCHACILLKTTK